jgi:phosphatidylglycerophosphate synthase
VISNLVTSLRLVLSVPLLVLLLQPSPAGRWAALGVFLLAGFTDVIDGRIARALGEVSKLGAMLDLISDRLLTLVIVIGLIANGELRGPGLVAGVALVARDLTAASFGEAAPGLGLRVTLLEKLKIALQMVGFLLLIAPEQPGERQHEAGRWLLLGAAALAAWTILSYARRTAEHLKA